jgi:hypothetical protein
MPKVLVIDAEIKKGIPSKNEPSVPGIEYCGGWRDFANMGIACLGGWQCWDSRARLWDEHTVATAQQAVDESDFVVTFNGLSFDGPLLVEHKVEIPAHKHVDLLVAVWKAHGLGPRFSYPSHAGFGLDAVCQANGIGQKTSSGALAPVLWQQGKVGAVIDYCLNDVWMTKELARKGCCNALKSPKGDRMMRLELPFRSIYE